MSILIKMEQSNSSGDSVQWVCKYCDRCFKQEKTLSKHHLTCKVFLKIKELEQPVSNESCSVSIEQLQKKIEEQHILLEKYKQGLHHYEQKILQEDERYNIMENKYKQVIEIWKYAYERLYNYMQSCNEKYAKIGTDI